MNQKQNLITPSFLKRYASGKFFKWVLMGSVPLFSVLVVLIIIQFVLGGNPFAAPESEDPADPPSVSDPLHPAEQQGPPMVYVPEEPERQVVNESYPIYKIMGVAPDGVTILSIDNFQTTNEGIIDNTLRYEINVKDAALMVSGYASDMSAISSFISNLESLNEYGTFTVHDEGRSPIGETAYTMFKLSVSWRAPG